MQRFDEQLRNGAERAFFQDDHCECQAHRRKINRQRREGVAFRHKLQHRSGKDADEPSGRNKMMLQHVRVGADDRRGEGQTPPLKRAPYV